MAASSTRHRLALAVAVVGVVASAVTLYVDQRLASDVGYTSFCNVSDAVNCDVVLASRYGRFLEVPVPVWAMAAFALGAALAAPGAFFGMVGGLADLLLVALVAGSLGFTLVMAGIAALVLKALCLLCLSMYVVVAAWAIVVLPLARGLPRAARGGAMGWRRVGYAAAVLGFVSAVAVGAWAAARVPPDLHTADAIRTSDPRFYEYYEQLPTSAEEALVGDDPHVKGEAGAPITIVEFSDFQCPACAQAFSDLHDLLRRRRDVRLVFRNFPLDDQCNPAVPHGVHPMACLAAAAAECAGRQGEFWQYHDLLFEHQAGLERESLFAFARDLHLDVAAFRTCLDDPSTLARVREDATLGERLGVASTPTIFINGRRIDGALERHYYDYAIILETQRASRAG